LSGGLFLCSNDRFFDPPSPRFPMDRIPEPALTQALGSRLKLPAPLLRGNSGRHFSVGQLTRCSRF
jgi:hypothetical protein